MGLTPRYTLPMDEVEIKFRVPDLAALTARLQALGLKPITPRTHEMNILFDLPGRPLRAKGDLLRLRKYGDTWLLTHKARAANDDWSPQNPRRNRNPHRRRRKNGSPSSPPCNSNPSSATKNSAPNGAGEKGHVVVDETPIGNFAEIEGPPDWIDKIARDLGVTPAHYITETYAALFFAWKRESTNPRRRNDLCRRPISPGLVAEKRLDVIPKRRRRRGTCFPHAADKLSRVHHALSS